VWRFRVADHAADVLRCGVNNIPKWVNPVAGIISKAVKLSTAGELSLKSLRSREHRAVIAVLVAARKVAGLTQQQVAVRLRKPQSFVSKYETGERRLDVPEFIRVSRRLGADPADLLRQVERRSES